MSRTSWLKRFMGLVAALALALMTALVVAAPPAHARVLTTSIKGIALDAQTSKGVAGVRVYAMERWYPWQEQFNDQDWALRAAAEAVTNKSGAYTLKLSEAGTYRVLFVPADLTRYAMEAYPNDAVAEAGDEVVVRYGKTTSGISVKLDPSNRIAGHIWAAESRWDGDGNDDGAYAPLDGVTVRVCFQSLVLINCYIRMPEQPDPVALGEAVTDETGAYSIPGFKAFPFFIWANPEGADTGFDPQLSSLMVDSANGDFPDGVKTSDAFLQSTSLANITGRLVDGDGNALAGKTIEVYAVDQSEQELSFWQKDCFVITDGDGRFGAEPDDARCLNLLEPAALLRFPGDGVYQDEYYRGSPDDWGATRIEVKWGWTTDIGDWVLTPNQ